MNKEFLKSLTILYVEDEDVAREQLGKSLKRLFKNVLLAKNGEDGLLQYQNAIQNNQIIDIILSDINMPKLNGIQMLEKIREVDKKIPFIFTTARSETEYLLKAIELNVHYYAIKPVNIQDIITRIEEVCEKRYLQSKLQDKTVELKNYIDAINHIAVIYTMNTDGNILNVNEAFKSVSQYEDEDIQTLSLEILLHPSIKKKYIQETWSEILNGNNWTGNTKYIDKNGGVFYLNITIFKIKDDEDKDEFVSLGFVTTDEIIKQREFHKKVMLNLKEHNQKEFTQEKTIKTLEEELGALMGKYNVLQESLSIEKQKNATHLKQLEHYEKSFFNKEGKRESLQRQYQEKLQKLSQEYTKLKREHHLLEDKSKKVEEQSDACSNEMKRLYGSMEKLKKEKLQLEDLVKFRESQIKLIDPSLLNK